MYFVFDDEGRPIDPKSVPMPKLCIGCARKLSIHDAPLCTINRLEQRNEPTFRCSAYIPLGEEWSGN